MNNQMPDVQTFRECGRTKKKKTNDGPNKPSYRCLGTAVFVCNVYAQWQVYCVAC